MDFAEQWIGESFTPDDVWQHRISKVYAHCQTAFQELYVVESGAYGKALVLDGRWQTCTGDEFLYHEPIVHVPCVLHGNPKRILIAGGADGGAAREALKWNSVEQIQLVDIDGAAVEACRQWLPEIHQGSLDDPRVQLQIADAFEFIQSAPGFDVIIADLTDPIESGPAYKLFTREFFEICRGALASGGIFVNQAGSLSPPIITPFARTAKTIGSVFPHSAIVSTHVPTYGSPWGLVIASDCPLNPQLDPQQVDELLRQKTNGQFRMFDGQTMLGLLQPPKHVREAIAQETTIYTLKAPLQITR